MIKKNDFIEIEFTGKIKDGGEIFDTNIKEDAEKAEFDLKQIKPFIIAIGNNMIVKGLDNELEGKDIGNLSINVTPELGFGKRDSKLVRMIPLKAFTEQKINPQKGMQLSLDGNVAKILSNSGGRVLVDFNNPLAGKELVYDVRIKRKVDDENEKVNALQDFFFRKRFDFNKKEKEITFKLKDAEKQIEKFIELMAKPFEDILGLKVKTEIVKEEKKVEKKE